MRTIAIINQKGGCGKTTTAINLSAVLAQKGHRTLLVDMDPQAHCALGLAVPEAQVERSLSDLIRHGVSGKISVSDIAWQIARNFDLAPSTMALAGIEAELATASDKDRRLVQVLAPVQDKYDFCIIDCPPSIGLLTFNALRAADEVIVPVETGYFALQGSLKQEATIEMLARRAGHHVRFKALATMYDVRTKLAREILAELRKQFGDRLLPVVVHFNSKLKEAASFGQAITEYDPGSRGYQDFEKLHDWLLANPPEPVVLEPMEADENGEVPATGVVASTNPALSRAAELVERARVLSARTAQLADRLNKDIDAREETPVEELEPIETPFAPAAAMADVRATSLASVSASALASASTTALAPASVLPGSAPSRIPTPIAASSPAVSVTVESPRTSPASSSLASQAPAPETQTGLLPSVNVLERSEKPLAPKPTLTEKLAKIYGARITQQGLLFVQPGDAFATQVYVAGDFNNWSRTDTPLRRNEELGVWQACVPVPPGRYRYRLVVDGKWKQDPFNSYVESNPFGELNNVVEVDVES